MRLVLRWLPLAALLAACTQGPSHLASISIEKVSIVELPPGYQPDLGLTGPPLSATDRTPGRALVVDLAPPDTLLSIAHRAHFSQLEIKGNIHAVASKWCQTPSPFDFGQKDGLGGLGSTIDGAPLDYQRDTFPIIKRANPGGKLRATFALRIVDTSHPSGARNDSKVINVDDWRKTKPNLCLRFFVLFIHGDGDRYQMDTTMQSDVLLIPNAELERVLAAPPSPAP